MISARDGDIVVSLVALSLLALPSRPRGTEEFLGRRRTEPSAGSFGRRGQRRPRRTLYMCLAPLHADAETPNDSGAEPKTVDSSERLRQLWQRRKSSKIFTRPGCALLTSEAIYGSAAHAPTRPRDTQL